MKSQWSRVKELFESALELAPEERERFLATACSSDYALKSQLGRLLSDHARAGSFLQKPIVQFESCPPNFVASSHRFSPGDIVQGRFAIVRFLGAGGMGEVYEAHDVELRERIALKSLRFDFGTDERMLRHFRQEVQLARKVTHPNVCRLFDIGRLMVGEHIECVFLTMELIEGETLRQRLHQSGIMEYGEAQHIAGQMSSALTAAHAARVVHHDFKPGNVMLCPSDDGVRAVVTDFGLARSLVPDLAGTTISILPAGTPAYMAPEQLRGAEVTAAADVYSYGLVLYEMVTGRLPFASDSPFELAFQRLHQVPASPRLYRSDIPRAWEDVIVACLERDPKSRPAMRDITQALAGRQRIDRNFRRFFRGSTERIWLLAIAAMLLMIGIINWNVVFRARRHELAESVRLMSREQAAHLGQQYTSNLEAYHHYLRGRHHWKRLTSDEIRKGIREFEQAIAIDPSFAPAYAGLADCYSALADYGGMVPKDAFMNARQAALHAIAIDKDLGEAYASLGLIISLDSKNWLEAEQNFVHAIELAPNYAPTHQWYAALLAKTGRLEQAVRESRIALDLDPLSAPSSTVHGWMLYFNRQYDEAIAQAERTIELDPNFRNPHLLLARIYERQGKFSLALQEANITTPQDLDTAVSLSIAGTVYARMGRREEALHAAKELQQRRPKENFPALYIAAIYSVLGNRDEAFVWLERAYEENDSSLLFLKVHPYYDSLRSDPRYMLLLRKLGLSLEGPG